MKKKRQENPLCVKEMREKEYEESLVSSAQENIEDIFHSFATTRSPHHRHLLK